MFVVCLEGEFVEQVQSLAWCLKLHGAIGTAFLSFGLSLRRSSLRSGVGKTQPPQHHHTVLEKDTWLLSKCVFCWSRTGCAVKVLH